LSAHKVNLAATSSFFSSVFSLHHHNHPLIYLKGIKTDQMQAVLTYIYSGGTKVAQEDLSRFLGVAEDLKIKRLTCEFRAQYKIKDHIFEATKKTSRKNRDEMMNEVNVNWKLRMTKIVVIKQNRKGENYGPNSLI
jgi:hypothetical protein